MKKKITILAINNDICQFFKKELLDIFGSLFEVDFRNIDMEPVPPIVDTNLILYTDPEILNLLIHTKKCDAPTLMMKRTITRKALRKIKEIPPGEKVFVANINEYMANETMALIHQLGVMHLYLYPLYPNKSSLPQDIRYIVAPEPYTYLMNVEGKLVIIGNRVFDVSNVLDIMSLLKVTRKKSEEIIKKYLHKVPTFWHGIEYTWENRRVMMTQLNLLLDELTSGILVIDDDGNIELINQRAKEIFGLEENVFLEGKLKDIVSQDKNLEFLLVDGGKKEELIRYKGAELILSEKLVSFDNNVFGKIIIVDTYINFLKVQQKIHKKIIGKGYYSKYNFSDLAGKDASFKEAQEVCKKIANTTSTILLVGESGSGKEIFAGAIHNYSNRNKKPFVAINCSTLPENLLETALFGYEEGAFTGAVRGGKIGLFEHAHEGTLFLDEIGDLPLNLQARLLRVLEEKMIMRVGGDTIFSVDVRIIAATNKDLHNLVASNMFRGDLYFRLNVFQINIPPIRDRSDDIELLIKHFLQEWNVKRNICHDFMCFIKNYPWPGNVRELKNVLHYMVTISDRELSFNNAPKYLKERTHFTSQNSCEIMMLLKIFYYISLTHNESGRRTVTEVFSKIFYKISEIEVRKMMDQLEAQELIEVHKGRRGSRINENGIALLKTKHFIFEEVDECLLNKISKLSAKY